MSASVRVPDRTYLLLTMSRCWHQIKRGLADIDFLEVYANHPPSVAALTYHGKQRSRLKAGLVEVTLDLEVDCVPTQLNPGWGRLHLYVRPRYLMREKPYLRGFYTSAAVGFSWPADDFDEREFVNRSVACIREQRSKLEAA